MSTESLPATQREEKVIERGKGGSLYRCVSLREGGAKTVSLFISSRYIAFSYYTAYSIYFRLTLTG